MTVCRVAFRVLVSEGEDTRKCLRNCRIYSQLLQTVRDPYDTRASANKHVHVGHVSHRVTRSMRNAYSPRYYFFMLYMIVFCGKYC